MQERALHFTTVSLLLPTSVFPPESEIQILGSSFSICTAKVIDDPQSTLGPYDCMSLSLNLKAACFAAHPQVLRGSDSMVWQKGLR